MYVDKIPDWASAAKLEAARLDNVTQVTLHPNEVEKNSWMVAVEFEDGDHIFVYVLDSTHLPTWKAILKSVRMQMIFKKGQKNA